MSRLFIVGILVVSLSQALAQVPTELSRRVAEAAQLQKKGATAEAKKIFLAVLADLRAVGPSPELGLVLNGLSQSYAAAGDYDAALNVAREAAATFGKIGDRDGEARAWNNTGVAHLSRGDYAAATDEFKQAFALAKLAGDAKLQTQALNNLGSVFYYQARYSEAFAAYDEAMQLLVAHSTADWHSYWRQITLFNQATLYQRLGDEQRALDIYREIRAQPAGLSSSDKAHLYANVGVLYRRLGDAVKAIETYRQAQQHFRAEKDNDGEIGVLKNIGIAQALDLNRPVEALRTFSRALRLAEKTGNRREVLQNRLYLGETLYRIGRQAAAAGEFQIALQIAGELGTVEEQWKALYALGRTAEFEGDQPNAEARYREAIAKIESLRSSLQLTSLRSDFLADKRDVYDGLVRLLLEREDVNGAFEFVERSRSRVFQDRFLADTPHRAPTSLPAVQALLPERTTLLEFWIGVDRIAVIWVSRGVAGIAESRVSPEQWVQLSDALGRLPESVDDGWPASLAPVTTLLQSIPPLQDVSARELLVVPDGLLSTVPFELAPGSDGRMLLEKASVTYLPSAILMFRRPLATQRWRWPWDEQLLAFGNPVVRSFSSALLSPASPPQSLPQSRAEITAIADMCTARAELYLGDKDSKSAFQQLGRAPLVHVSTHALIDAERPERSRLLFSPSVDSAENEYLFLREMYALDFRGVDLVTLSACDTERGRLVRGEGVQGFSRAILAGGARSAVTTLWQVEDQATTEFMKQFYYLLLKKGESKADALRHAKLKFVRSGGTLAQPRYWAAFVLYGENTRVPRFVSWRALAFLAGIAAMLAVWLVMGRRRKPRPARPGRQPSPPASRASESVR